MSCARHLFHVPRRRLLPLRLRSHAVRRASQASCSSRTSSARSSPPTALCSWEPTCAFGPAPTRRTLHAARSGLAPRPRGGQSARPCGFPARPSPPTHTVAPHGQLRLSLRPAVGQVANDMAHDQFCETTIGYKVPSRRPPRRPPRRPLPGLLPASSAVGALPSGLCFCVRLRSGLGSAHLLLPRLGGRTTPTVSSSRRPSTARPSRWASSRTRWAWSCAAL